MEAILAILKNNLQKTSVAIGVGVVAGLLVGLIFGWLVWPVQWTDGTPEVLRADLQRDYLRMTIDSYNRTGDVNTAMARWDNLGEAAGSTLIALKSDPGYLDTVKIDEFGSLVQSVKGSALPPGAEETPQTGGLGQLVIYASIAVVLFLLAVGVVPEGERDRHAYHGGRRTQPHRGENGFPGAGCRASDCAIHDDLRGRV
jgi:hypothetical protein